MSPLGVLRGLRWYVREVTGATAYDRYTDRHRACSPGVPPLSRREFERARVGVEVTVEHMDLGQLPTRIAAELHAGQGHDLIQYVAPLPQFEPAVLDLTDVVSEANRRWGRQLPLCRRSSYNPTTNRFYAY